MLCKIATINSSAHTTETTMTGVGTTVLRDIVEPGGSVVTITVNVIIQRITVCPIVIIAICFVMATTTVFFVLMLTSTESTENIPRMHKEVIYFGAV